MGEVSYPEFLRQLKQMHEDCYNDKENCGAFNSCKKMTIKFPETATYDCVSVDYESIRLHGLNQFNIDDATGRNNYKLPRIVCLNQDSDAESNNYRSFYVKYDTYKSSVEPKSRQCYMVQIDDNKKITDPYISSASQLQYDLGYSERMIKLEGDKLYFNNDGGYRQTHTEDKNYVFSPNFKIPDGASIRVYGQAEGMAPLNRWVKLQIKISGGADANYAMCHGNVIPLNDLCNPEYECNINTHVHCISKDSKSSIYDTYDTSITTDAQYCASVCGAIDKDYCESLGYSQN